MLSPSNQAVLKWFLSLWILFHFGVVLANGFAQRGTSFLVDAFLSNVATYSAFGNWRADTTALTVANASQLGESMQIEVHSSGDDESTWRRLSSTLPEWTIESPQERAWRAENITTRWINQLHGLLYFENDEGVGKMLSTALSREQLKLNQSIDQVRIRVAARPNQDQFDVVKNKDQSGYKPDDSLNLQTVFAANVIDLGTGQLSLLPQLEDRRVSKSLPSSSQTPDAKGKP